MLKIENVEVMGWEAAIRGMRNPMNSWEKSDSYRYSGKGPSLEEAGLIDPLTGCNSGFEIGDNDLKLMTTLRNAGTDHRKFMRMIAVYMDITAPLYWWKEFDTYKVGTVANSCSTMHKIAAKEFTLDDFSCEHLYSAEDEDCDEDLLLEVGPFSVLGTTKYSPKGVLGIVIKALNIYRELYLETKDKGFWWQMIQLLPSSYNQKRTIMLNYEVLANMYKSRKNHKLDEWHTFCDWIETLPYAELITGEGKKE